VLQVPTDKCKAPDQILVKIVSQDGDGVTFSISQEGCNTSKKLGWIATDYVGKDGELTCIKAENQGCNSASLYTAQCIDGASVVDVYVYDKDHLGQTDGLAVDVPTACGPTGDPKMMCHFRYILKCESIDVDKSSSEGRRLGRWHFWTN
jgi:hypothetical protein